MNLKENKLIAEFMSNDLPLLKKDLKRTGTLESMHYATDWLWLMPVVEKIESISITGLEKYYDLNGDESSEGNFSVVIFENSCIIYANVFNYQYDRPVNGLNGHTDKTKLIATYKACVQFIKWWNKNKPKKLSFKEDIIKNTKELNNE